MDAVKKTINDIFNGNRILEIPFFQRSYVWGKDQWERLLEDMELVSVNPRPYFLGSLILKQQLIQTGNQIGDVRTVIDGQQRLTTLNIFFKVLSLKIGNINLFDRTFRLSNNNFALHHNHNDIESFNKVLSLKYLDDIETSGKDKIIEAYKYFKDNIDPDKLVDQNILTRILFVAIDLNENEDEQQIFDTINSLGVRLTTAELLKNYFFSRNEIDNYNKYWKDVFEKDEETKNYWDRVITAGRTKRTFIDLFFFSFLQIKIQDADLKISAEDKIYFSRVETLFESYKNLINYYKINRVDILEEIREYAKIFISNFDYDVINRDLTAEPGIERINAIIFGLENSTLIPYVLFILKNVSDTKIKRELFHSIESYIMLRMITHASTKNYNQLFTDRLISNRILNKKLFHDYIAKKSDRVNFLPDEFDIREAFQTATLVNKQATGIIYFIESKIRNRSKQSTQLLGLHNYSLEHIMPKKWENNWGKIKRKDLKENRNQKLLTLGNLTIITQSLNASIRDAEWKIKKDGNGNKAGLTQYSSGIETIAPFLVKEKWNEEMISERAEFLLDHVLNIWEYDKRMSQLKARAIEIKLRLNNYKSEQNNKK